METTCLSRTICEYFRRKKPWLGGNPPPCPAQARWQPGVLAGSGLDICITCGPLHGPLGVLVTWRQAFLKWVVRKRDRQRTPVPSMAAPSFIIYSQSNILPLSIPMLQQVENTPTNARNTASIHQSGKIPWRGKWQPTPVFLPGKSHGQRSPVDYSPWGLKESDTTEWLNMQSGKTREGLYQDLHPRGRGSLGTI